MHIYPSCLSNRIEEAGTHLHSVKKDTPSLRRYPYSLIDFSVRMRPIVEVIDEARKTEIDIKLLHFEKSRLYRRNDKYLSKHKVALKVILGAIIHEKYIHIGRKQGDKETIRLDVWSDRGRWIVEFSEFINKLESYILTRDEIATVVCDIVDNLTKSAIKAPEKFKATPPEIGNFDLNWLLSDYSAHEITLKKSIMSEIFNIDEVPEKYIRDLRFSANSVSYQNFDLYFMPTDWLDNNSTPWEKISWTMLTYIFRNYLNSK